MLLLIMPVLSAIIADGGLKVGLRYLAQGAGR